MKKSGVVASLGELLGVVVSMNEQLGIDGWRYIIASEFQLGVMATLLEVEILSECQVK